ncbi:hypothetical protein [Romboutsia lituseburensis]|uniref:hypothetical protein n=1 Tax=Romboutsia lituseburensis TaxID=1537 RepID=UPI00215A11E9|nr:hypothetical protein [Romboutsia lituseburensis]MCR8744497.1 hypothetical protein [Romboutsia lituseburensis]
MYLKHLDINKVRVEGITCESIVQTQNSGVPMIMIDLYSNPNFVVTKIYGLDNLYMSDELNYQSISAIIVGEDETSIYILTEGTLTLQKMDKDKLANMVTLQEVTRPKSFDRTIYLKDVEGTNKYKIVVEAGYGYENNGSVGERVVEYTLLLDKSCKKFGFIWVNQDLVYYKNLKQIYSSYKEYEVGMKIDTSLDKEPLYYCDGTKDRLILTEDMIVRGNTNFTEELTYNDKRILCEGNLG